MIALLIDCEIIHFFSGILISCEWFYPSHLWSCHIDHSLDLTGDNEGDDELYYLSDEEYDSDSD